MNSYMTTSPEMTTTRLTPLSATSAPRKKREQIQTILVPIDFSQESIRSLKYSVAWAEKFGAAIHVVNVRPSSEEMALERTEKLTLDVPDTIALLQDRLAEIQEKHDVHFSPDHCYVETGRPFEEICKLASHIEADLIILPTHGRSGVKRILLGSTAERVIRYAPCPVLIVRGRGYRPTALKARPNAKLEIRKILAPVDFSECSLAGVKYSAFLTEKLGARLRLLHVVSPYTQIFVTDRDKLETEALVKTAKRQAEMEMETVRKLPFLRQLECEQEIRIGAVVDEICADSAQPEIDLIVSSTHGRTGFRHALIGSVTEHIARYAECPVLITPSK